MWEKGLVGGELTLLDGLGEQSKCSCSCSGDLFEQAEDMSHKSSGNSSKSFRSAWKLIKSSKYTVSGELSILKEIIWITKNYMFGIKTTRDSDASHEDY